MLSTEQIDRALATSEKIFNVYEQARTSFYERDDALLAMATALCCGEHMVMLGKPGTGKTALGNYFAQSLGVKYFYRGLNADTKMEDLLGPVSPTELKRDIWTRKWAGLATSPLAFCDEAGKASSTVQDFLLGAMQERIATIADTVHPLPLHSMLSGSNETLSDNAAFYDRFLVRVLVNQIESDNNFAGMLTADLAPSIATVDSDDLANLRQVTGEIALKADKMCVGKVILFRSHFKSTYQHYISDRRWKAGLKLAAGAALLSGETSISVPNLHCYKWLLWDDAQPGTTLPAHIQTVYQFIEEESNQEMKNIREKTQLLIELETLATTLPKDTNIDVLAMAILRAKRLQGDMKGKNSGEWQDLIKRAAKVEDALSAIGMEE